MIDGRLRVEQCQLMLHIALTVVLGQLIDNGWGERDCGEGGGGGGGSVSWYNL